MKIIPTDSVRAEKVDMEGTAGAKIRWMIDRNIGAKNFAMRIFDIEPGGHTPLHRHDWEHEIYVIEGEAVVAGEGAGRPAAAGDAVFVPGGELHQFRNEGTDMLRVMCLIPDSGY